jgi:2-oxoglutarate ferredoxin oxidoreductase subunit gamma
MMMKKDQLTIQFCGFGGQGIVLSSVILGTTAVLHSGMNAVQTQSYGSEARGGECQAELILSRNPIKSPLADKLDILVAMSQPALNQYLSRLKPGGTLILDPEFVGRPDRTDVQIISVPATEAAGLMGNKIVANMFMLGFIQQLTGLITSDSLCEVISENVPARFIELNQKAARNGMAFAKELNVSVEV